MKKKILWLMLFCILTTTSYAATQTTMGITLDFNINTTTTEPNRLTIEDAAHMPTSYATKYTDVTGTQTTYTGHISPDYHLNSYIKVTNSNDLTTTYCTSSVGTNAVCSFNSIPSTPPLVFYCTPNGGCSKGQTNPTQFESGEATAIGIKLTYSVDKNWTAPPASSNSSSSGSSNVFPFGNSKSILVTIALVLYGFLFN